MGKKHLEQFNQLCSVLEHKLQHDNGWRERVGARMILILEGFEEGMRNVKTRTALQTLYEDYSMVRACQNLMFKMFNYALQ